MKTFSWKSAIIFSLLLALLSVAQTTGTLTTGSGKITGGSGTISLSGLHSSLSEKILSATLQDGKFVIEREVRYGDSLITCTGWNCSPSIVREIWRETYEAKDGKIALAKKIQGTIIPAQAERVEWPTGDK